MFSFLRNTRSLSELIKFSNLHLSRNYGSALFISGNKATEAFSYLSPYLDFNRRFENFEKLKKDLSLRGTEINIVELKETWDFYKNIVTNKEILEQRKSEVVQETSNLMQKKELTQEEEARIIALRAQNKILKQDIKIIKQTLWDLEEVVVIRALKLPNEIDEKTPNESPVVLKIVGEPINLSSKVRKSHLDIGKELGIIEFTNSLQYYLCNEAAMFELATLEVCGEILGEDAVKIAGSDFSRSLIIEGSGLNHEDPMESFILADDAKTVKNSLSRLHLVGGASLASFLLLHTKKIINTRNFPLRYFATGKQYMPILHNSFPMGLFNISQSSAVSIFSIVQEPTSDDYNIEFDNLMHKAIDIYDKLAIHYRIVIRSASQLQPWESRKVAFELWSPFYQQYFEVGFISAYGDFISKRLRIAYQNENCKGFPAVISGTLVSFPRLLACVLEQNPYNLKIPDIIQSYLHR